MYFLFFLHVVVNFLGFLHMVVYFLFVYVESSLGCIIHLIKSSLGVGILAMPSAFKHSGLLFGIFGTIITGIICSHCVQMLVGNLETFFTSGIIALSLSPHHSGDLSSLLKYFEYVCIICKC